MEHLGSSEYPVEAPSSAYSPAHAELDSHGAINPDQSEIASVLEIPAEPMQRKPLPAQSSVPRFSGTSLPESKPASSAAGPADQADTSSAGTGPSKVDILQERLESVRAEKDRLSKLQQLEEMEAALQLEVMAELKKERLADGLLYKSLFADGRVILERTARHGAMRAKKALDFIVLPRLDAIFCRRRTGREEDRKIESVNVLGVADARFCAVL